MVKKTPPTQDEYDNYPPIVNKKGHPKKEYFYPTYPDKYQGDYPIIARSSWETEFMNFCDHNPAVLEWASEPTFGDKQRGIPYPDPLSGDQKIYIPDFLVKFVDASGHEQVKLIEIKPLHETSHEFCRNARDEAIYYRNIAKWTAARSWCDRRGIEFTVLTEQSLFSGNENMKPPVKKTKAPKKPGRKRVK